ncbi:SgcJ/EcaC family oxidoreductase [Thioalkalivibrio sp. HL-Eb18]|uniref:SgcJ/EcaC family oxidoreductase n=1 Tax=Thioalkalivibrio sp. HL-Eb18 TaxID=1266913 RepID=UPI000366CA3D|nr:SgcJ/EcaC family oxidoreductase [Thioalkalivibrio sp. HL-Eb18]
MSKKMLSLAVLPFVALASTAGADEGEIQRILEAKEAAWEAGDGEAWARDYQDDAGLINLFGMRFDDRETNAKRHSEVFQGPFAGTSLDVDVQDIAMLNEDLAFAEAVLRVSDIEAMPAGLPDRGDDVLYTRMSFLLERDDHHGWQIRFGHNTVVHP